MANSNVRRFRTLLCGAALYAMTNLACGSEKKPDDEGMGAGKTTAGTKAPAADAGGKTNTPDAGKVNLPDANIVDDEGMVLTPEQQFEGVPFDAIKGVPPKGCLEAAGGDDSTLVLKLDDKVLGVRLAAPKGKISANGMLCTTASAPSTIKITGTNGIDTVIIDGSQGMFPAALVEIDLGMGKDTVAVMGTTGMDKFTLSSATDKAIVQAQAGGPLPKISTINQEILVVSAGPGDDRIEAGAEGAVALNVPFKGYGGLGSDVLISGAKDDELHGGSGDDLFQSASKPDGADVYDGGMGLDTLSYELRTGNLSVKLNDAPDDGEANERDNVQMNVEGLVGGSGADTFTGSAADNTFIGGPGNDTLNGEGGDDMFLEVAAPVGADVMNGGDGQDTVDYSGRTIDMNVSLCISTPLGCNSGACGCAANDGQENEKDTLTNIEGVFTGSGRDVLNGSTANNVLSGGAGNDELHGGLGDDTLFGDDGADLLDSGEGDDALFGGDGTDAFDAGSGEGDICVFEVPETPKGCELR